ncbi:MAG TPA: CoA pyrophosphatase [Mycobacteriales bacterium]|nr:CoA pyrophosphatase [Mycobacteriales bacterium]
MTAATVPPWLVTLVGALPGVRGEQLSRFLPPPGQHRHSAVLCLFGDGERGPEVLLIERAATLRSHAGQPAFPGGALDPEDGAVDDAGHVRAALREAEEEVGLRSDSVELLGVLPALWLPPSGFVVHPVVAWWREPHDVAAVDTAEVAAVARVPLADLVDPANRLQVTHPSGWVGPAFEVHDLLVWGFTAGLLDKLLELGGWAVPWDTGRRRELDADTLALALRSSPRRVGGRPTPEEIDAARDAEATGAG